MVDGWWFKVQGSRLTVHDSRFTVHGWWLMVQGSRFKVNDSRFTFHGSRFTVHGWWLMVDGSRFKFQGSSFKVQGSRLTVHDSRFTVHGSRLMVDGWWLMVQVSSFKVQGSRFTVHGSRFTIHNSRFTVDGWCDDPDKSGQVVMICLCNNYLLIITLTNLLITTSALFLNTDSAPACEKLCVTLQIISGQVVILYWIERWFLNCFTELHYVHTELRNVLLCETLCYSV